jgi:hypothetical protein
MLQQVLAYIVFFDSALPDDTKDNYYMEREWRVVGGFEFSIEDVSGIVMPQEYSRAFRNRVPAYCGQLSFSGG